MMAEDPHSLKKHSWHCPLDFTPPYPPCPRWFWFSMRYASRKWFCNLELPSAPLFRGIQCLGLATESRGLLPDETRHVRKKSFTFSFPHFLHRHVETLATFDQSWDRQAHGNCLMTKLSCCWRLKSSVWRRCELHIFMIIDWCSQKKIKKMKRLPSTDLKRNTFPCVWHIA